MRAVVFESFGEPAIRDVRRPTPDDESVLVSVSRVQLSITECWLYRGREVLGHESVKELIDRGDGRLFGHEFCGEVVDVGQSVSSLDIGDRVFAPGPVPCGSCQYCASDSTDLCADRAIIGMDRPGALAEYVTLPESALQRLPDGVSDVEGAAMQPVATALVDVLDADVSTGDVVITIGAGVMGNHCGQLALHQGADTVFALDIRPEIVELANRHGLEGINTERTDPAERILERTAEMGADVVFEAVGGPHDHTSEGDDPLAQALRLVRMGGTIAQVGIIPGEMTMSPLAFQHNSVSWVNGRDLAGSIRSGPNSTTAKTAVEMVRSGRVSISEFVSHEREGLKSVEEAIDITMQKDEFGALGPAQIVLD
jgi:threonine dehydrogenase-like Zn-dependent dehydrogenase